MMPLFWVLLWSMLPPLILSCGPHCCIAEESLQKTSALLTSLQCHNDYESYVHCQWRKLGNESLQLWFKTENDVEECAPHGTSQCRYKTGAFSIGIKHTVFFVQDKMLTPCSSVRHKPRERPLQLRTRPPVNVSTRGAGDAGRRLVWSSPYPSSSTLNEGIAYQLSYRTDRQDDWTTEELADTSVKLEKRLLLPGRLYEARVRARAREAQWSVWSAEVTWRTPEGTGLFPSLHCVLDGETAATCSWDVSREVDHFITYQLACRHVQTVAAESCCVNLTVSPDPGRPVLRYSCSLAVADPAHLLVELLPARKAKTFHALKHIRPGPPQQVRVKQRATNWMVEWNEPSTASKVRLHYQVCYYSTQEQGSYVLMNVSEGSKSLNILGTSLVPSRHYSAKLRSLVNPNDYEGIPSEWTDPVEWTSQDATWSPTTLIYLPLALLVAAVFLTMYFTIPACRRRAVLWVNSVPSPGKSKILSEIKSASNKTLMQGERLSICQVMRLDSIGSTCSSAALLWPSKDTGQKHLEQDEGCRECDNLPPPAEKDKHFDTSSMSFSGPYILCQTSEASQKSTNVQADETEMEQEPPSDDFPSPPPVMSAFYGEGYVCLPGRSVFESTQDLVFHSGGQANTHRHNDAEQDQQGRGDTEVPPGPSETCSSSQAATSRTLPPWFQAQASGYCHFPAAFKSAAK
ncbi:cytokine receptor common subunit beta isoform 2-T2 [Spinachia spinachia]